MNNYVIFACVIALALDWTLMRAWKKHVQDQTVSTQHELKDRHIFQQYFPILTWLWTKRRIVWTRFFSLVFEPIHRRITEDVPSIARFLLGCIRVRWNATHRVYVFSILILAALPPLLVFQDRWLRDARFEGFIHPIACRFNFLCASSYPAYFTIVFLALVLLLALLLPSEGFFQVVPNAETKAEIGAASPSSSLASYGRLGWWLLCLGCLGSLAIVLRGLLLKYVPGWELVLALALMLLGLFLREVHLQAIFRAWARHRDWLIAYAWAHLSLILLLDNIYSSPQFNWIFLLLLVLAGLNLLRYYRQVPVILWIFSLALVLFVFNINAWWLSAIGDEYEFYFWGKAIAQDFGLAHTAQNLFSYSGAYGTHPYLSSVLQAISMALLGSNGFGWRFSSLYFSALSILFFYAFFHSFISRRLALTAALFLTTSHYIMSFGKIGYNNLQALFALSLALWASARAFRTRTPVSYAILGLAIGFCFYVYPAALYAVPIPFVFLLFYDPPSSRSAVGRWGVMLVFALLLIFPLFLQPEYWQSKVQGTFLYSTELRESLPMLLRHFFLNYVFAFFSYIYTPEEGHFIAVSYMNPLAGLFVSIGLVNLLRFVRRDRFALFAVVSFLAMVFFAGASHDNRFPPSTRLFMLLPWFALFAAYGLWWLIEHVKQLTGKEYLSRRLFAGAFVVVLGLSLYQAYPLARDRMTGFQSLQTLFLRLLQRAQDLYPGKPQTFVFITDPNWTSTALQHLPKYYPLQAKFGEVMIDQPRLPDSAKPLLSQTDTFVILKPWSEEPWKAALGQALLDLGKTPCDINTTNGYPRFQLWHSPKMDALCQ